MMIRILVLATLLLTATAAGQSLYVSDELVITLRSGPSTSEGILTNLRSGDLVEILEVDSQLGYSLVRAPDGTEGWVLSRYLTEQPIGRDRLAAQQQTLAEARARIGELEHQLATLSEGLEQSDRQLEQLRLENRLLQDGTPREWFVVGAGVLLGGIVIGVLLSSLRPKRRSRW